MQVRAQPGQSIGIAVSRDPDRDARLFDRLPDRGNARGGIIGVEIRKTLGKRPVPCVHPTAGEHDRAARKHHRRRALDEQILIGAAIGRSTKEDQRRSGNGIGHDSTPTSPGIAKRNTACHPCCVTIVEILGLAASLSLLSGWRVYLCVFVAGLAMNLGLIDLPQHLTMLQALANWWVMAIAALGFLAEFFVDKIAWADTLWDAVHTAIRPVGGALLALAVVDASDPAWQAATVLLGGGAALLGHGAKAGTRALVNVSPEPFSNILVSSGEDVATGGLLALAVASPAAALGVAVLVAAGSVVLIIWARRLLRRLMPARAN